MAITSAQMATLLHIENQLWLQLDKRAVAIDRLKETGVPLTKGDVKLLRQTLYLVAGTLKRQQIQRELDQREEAVS